MAFVNIEVNGTYLRSISVTVPKAFIQALECYRSTNHRYIKRIRAATVELGIVDVERWGLMLTGQKRLQLGM